jgi:hypothetical protein
MKTLIPILLCVIVLSGCAGGPTHDYYNPALVNGPRFKGPVTVSLVDNVVDEQKKCLADGYTVIGSTAYMGKYPEAVELNAQAKRVHANHVIYSAKRIPAPPGSWHFSMGGWGGGGGTDNDSCEVKIVFLGR